jgi:hypothetical protein
MDDNDISRDSRKKIEILTSRSNVDAKQENS